MKKAVLLSTLLLAGSASASGVENAGRISIGAGARWVPQWWFIEHAATAGTPVVEFMPFGPSLVGSFGYGIAPWLELSIDLLGGWQPLAIQRSDGIYRYNSFMGAGAIGGRLIGKKLWGPVSPWLTAMGGGLFSSLSGPDVAHQENFKPTFIGGAGIDINVNEHYGLSIDVRYLYGRNMFSGITNFNAGGVMLTISFVMFFAAEQKRELDVPGF
jgi:hypothetical protein